MKTIIDFVSPTMTAGKRLASVGVSAARNAELIAYQQRLRMTRLKYQQEFKDQPSKSQLAEQIKSTKADLRNTSWKAYIHNLKEALEDPESSVYHPSHPCRPTIHRPIKSDNDRKRAEMALSNALAPHQLARRRVVAILANRLDLVTRDNLEARIDEAIAKPVNYNLKPETMSHASQEFRKQLATTRVPRDELIHACKPPNHQQ